MKKRKKKKPSAKKTCEEVLAAGFGGQGIMFLGKLLAQAGLGASKHVTWMPSYGAEVRGGTAYSMAKISDIDIGNPVVTNPDFLIVMNKPSFEKYEGIVKKDGTLILNTTLIDSSPKRKDIKCVKVPMTALASKLGDTRCANMIAMGALAKRSRILSLKDITAALRIVLKGKEGLFSLNKKALERGYKI